jgi:hypothetical protein
MSRKRKQYGAEFKALVALAGVRGGPAGRGSEDRSS